MWLRRLIYQAGEGYDNRNETLDLVAGSGDIEEAALQTTATLKLQSDMSRFTVGSDGK